MASEGGLDRVPERDARPLQAKPQARPLPRVYYLQAQWPAHTMLFWLRLQKETRAGKDPKQEEHAGTAEMPRTLLA